MTCSLLLILLLACNEDVKVKPSNEFLTVTLDLNDKHQTISGFGASDAWSTQFVGANWPINKKNQMADLLFSLETDNENNPLGIGLSSWRFNFGAGSAYQGVSSAINDEWRRAESFLNLDGSFNPQAHTGQRWFLGAAKERGVNRFIAFVNSPPVFLTKNNKAYSSGGSSSNITSENYPAFSSYLISALDEIKKSNGISFESISPFNEPQWDWSDAGQEGSPWRNTELNAMAKVLNNDLEASSHNDIQIELPEAAQLNFLYSSGLNSGRDDQVDAFFNSSNAATYLGNVSRVSKKVAGHSYFTTWPLTDFVETRNKLNQKVGEYSTLGFEMTEYCPLENNSEIVGNGRDLGMDLALYGARVMHVDLTIANAMSWSWWLAISPYNYKDGLIYIDKSTTDGRVFDSKMLWALGNYSRFVRPGYQRVTVSRSDLRTIEQTLGGVMVSAFVDPISNKTVSVVINHSANKVPLNIEILNNKNRSWKYYRTSDVAEEDLKYMGIYTSGSPTDIPARSITTFVQQD